MGYQGLVLECLGWLKGRGVGVYYYKFMPVRVLIDNWCALVVCWAVDGRELVLVSPGILSLFFSAGGAAFLWLAWTLWSKPGMCQMWFSLAWC